jgi:hypothetical protein
MVDAYPAAATGKILKHKLLSYFSDLIKERDRQIRAINQPHS